MYFSFCLCMHQCMNWWFICNKWWKRIWKQIWKSLQWNVRTRFHLENEKHFTYEATFLDLHLCKSERQIQVFLYDKRLSYNFSVVRFPYNSSTITSKMSFATISVDMLWICWATASVIQFVKTFEVFLHKILRQGAVPLGVKKVIVKMISYVWLTGI